MRPTLLIRASSPQTQVYMALQPKRFTQSAVTNTTRELLPHVFTFTCRSLGGGGLLPSFDKTTARQSIFCGTFCVKRHPSFPKVWRSMLSGLSSPEGATDRFALQRYAKKFSGESGLPWHHSHMSCTVHRETQYDRVHGANGGFPL